MQSFLVGLLCNTPEESLQYLKKAANMDHVYAQYQIAQMSARDSKSEESLETAIYYFSKLLSNGSHHEYKVMAQAFLESLEHTGSISARCNLLMGLLPDENHLQRCTELLNTIEALPYKQFIEHIQYLDLRHTISIERSCETNNRIAYRLKGYIYHYKASKTKLNSNEWRFFMHSALRYLNLGADSDKAREAIKDISFTLSTYYKSHNNEATWFRLAQKAESLNHEATFLDCALYRLKRKHCPNTGDDLQKLQISADQGNSEAIKFLADLYYEDTALPCKAIIRANHELAYKYLSLFCDQQLASGIHYYRLAKLLAHLDGQERFPKDLQKAHECLTTAKAHGYLWPPQDFPAWALVCLELQKYAQALEILEQCPQDKPIAWSRCLARIHLDESQEPIAREDNDKKLWADLAYVLTIENDSLELPTKNLEQIELVCQKLQQNLEHYTEVPEIFIRFCYAAHVNNFNIDTRNIIRMINSLASTQSLSTWSFISFLNRKGQWMPLSIREALKYLLQILDNQTIPPWILKEAIAHLTCLVEPILQSDFNFHSHPDNDCHLIASHVLIKLIIQSDPQQAARLFLVADKIILENCADNRMLNLAKEIGSLAALKHFALDNNIACAAAVALYMIKHILQESVTAQDMQQWLDQFEKVELSNRASYTIGTDKKLDLTIATILNYIGLSKYETLADQRAALPYFLQALNYCPTLEIAKHNVAHVYLNTHPTLQEEITAIRYMRELANGENPSAEDCYLLGVLQHPQLRPPSFSYNPNREAAMIYLKKAADLGYPRAQQTLLELESSSKKSANSHKAQKKDKNKQLV